MECGVRSAAWFRHSALTRFPMTGKKSSGPQSARVSRERILVLAVPPVFMFPLLQQWEVLTEFPLESQELA
jgi:hypothetical protein